MNDIRHDWSTDEITALFDLPLMDLVYRAQTVHRAHNVANSVQLATLLSVKTGACSEDCAYCPQSSHYKTFVENDPGLPVDKVLAAARIPIPKAQVLCFLAGANSIFYGEKLLTTGNPESAAGICRRSARANTRFIPTMERTKNRGILPVFSE